MVLEAPKPKRPDAVCCKVEVVKGASGFLRYNFVFTSSTLNFVLLITSINPITLIVIVSLIGLSDALDGFLARKYNAVTSALLGTQNEA